jgi:hypothetical protein
MKEASIIKKMLLSMVTIIAGATIFLLTGCQKKSSLDSSLYSTEIIDSVKHIHNFAPQFENAPKAELELLGKIGKLEAEKEVDLLYDPIDVARLPNGDILILERDGCTMKRYNKNHEYLSSFGQRGQGPGDFLYPFRLKLNEEKLYVADSRISIFSLEGEYEGSFKPPGIHVFGSIGAQYKTSGMTVLPDSQVILPSHPSEWMKSGESKLLSIYDKTGTLIRAFGAVKLYDNPLLTVNANIVYFDKDNHHHIYTAFAYQNKICKYSPEGEMIFSSDRPLSFEVKNTTRVETFKSGNMEQKFETPSVSSVTKGIGIDRKNRVWVLTYLKQPNRSLTFDEGENLTKCYEFDVFDSNGILLFKVPFPNVQVDNLSIYNDRIYLIDNQHESCVYEYKIVED